MTLDLAAGIVRILRPDGTTSGTGFVVSDSGLIATCSHVIQSQASQIRGDSRPERVTVIFNATGERREAIVQPDWWRDAVKEDVAILQLEGTLPPGTQSLPLGSSVGTSSHGFKTYGFPDARSEEGLWGYGTIGDLLPVEPGRALLQLTGTTEVSPGFSGAPLLDTLKRRVVGMVTAITAPDQYGRLVETAFITTSETLRAICPVLRLSDICPYLGLSFFTELDAEFFFGRQQVVERLLESLKREPRFLAVLGPSGCGKSSLIRAKLIPELRRGAVPGSDKWGIIIARTADQPLEQLLVQGLQAQSTDLLEAVKKWQGANPDKTRLVLILDQFEETLVACPDQLCQSFIYQLSSLLDSPLPVTLIIVMRDEFYSRFVKQASSLLTWLEMGLVNIPSTIDKDELIVIVREPARVVGLEFETGLAEDCVNDVLKIAPGEQDRIGQSTALPLLEFALTQLWERRSEGVLTHEAYKFVGGVTGCLAQWADQAYSSLETEQRPLVRCVLTSLVHLGDESQGIPDSKRQRPLTDLCGKVKDRETVRRVVDKLAGERLLTTSFDKKSGLEIVDIIHDALIREWGQLQQWLKEDRVFLLWSQGVDERARAWIETDPTNPGKRDDGRLLRGRDLNDAEDRLKERGSDLSEEQREFVQASLDLQSKEKAERERQRRRNLGIIITAVLVVIISLSYAAINYQKADMQAKFTHAEELAASSVLIENGQAKSLPLAIALAIESLQERSTDEARRALNLELTLLPSLVSSMTHKDPVYSVAFSPDNSYIATVSNGTAGLWEAASGREVTNFGHYDNVKIGTFSPNGIYFATGGYDNTARLWEIPSGRLIKILNHSGAVNSVTFSLNGEYLATGSDDKTAKVWKVPSGQMVFSKLHNDTISAVKFSHDGTYLAAICNDYVHLWNLNNSHEIAAPLKHEGIVTDISFDHNGKYIATSSKDNTARLWYIQNGSEIKRLFHKGSVNSVSFSSNDQYLATASDDNNARVWDVVKGNEIARMPHEWQVVKAVFSPNAEYLGTASLDGTARIMAVQSGLEVLRMTHDDSVWDVAFSPNGRYLATASIDKTARVWIATENRLVERIIHDGAVKKVLFSPNGRYLAIVGDSKTARLWNISSSRYEANLSHNDSINDITFSPNGNYVATASDDKTARLWDIPGGRLIKTMPHSDGVWTIAFSPDGNYLATGSEDDTARIWEVPSGRRIMTLNHSGPVHSVAFNPMGEYLATGSDDKVARLWKIGNGTPVASINHDDHLDAVAFSPNGEYLATAGADKKAKLWDISSGKIIADISHDGEVTSIAFSNDSKYLATSSIDGFARLWNIPEGRQDALMKHGNEVWSVAFRPDGKYLATGSDDKIARVWPVPSDNEVVLLPHAGHVNTVTFSPTGNYLATGSDDGTASIWVWSPIDPTVEACSRLTSNPPCEELRQYFPNDQNPKPCPNLPGGCG